MQLVKAERSRQRLIIAVTGVTGGGKTYTALRLAHALAKGGLIGVVDSENGSAQLYAGEANPDGGAFDFLTIDLAKERGKFSVDNYIKAIDMMSQAGVQVLVIDSLTHAWNAEGGVLAVVDRNGNRFAGWKDGTPQQNRLMQAMLGYPGHTIATMRSKMEHVQDGKNIRKVGMAPIQRDGIEYEFTLQLDMDTTNQAVVAKTRISSLQGQAFHRPGKDLADALLEWLGQAPMTATRPEPPPPEPPSSEPQREDEPDLEVDEKPARDGFRRAFFDKWGEVFPTPTLKEGISPEDVAKAKAAQDELRATCLQKWFGVSSINDVPYEKVGPCEKALRASTVEAFKAKVDLALGEVQS